MVLTAANQSPLDLPEFVNRFSPSAIQTISLASGFNAIDVPDQTNQRGVLIMMPDGNIVTWTMKGITGDTGFPQHPNGCFLTSFNGSAPATIGLTTGGTITGAIFVWF